MTTPVTSPCQGMSETRSPAVPLISNLVVAEKDFFDAIVKTKVKRRRSKVDHESDVAEGLVKTSAEGSKDNDLFGI